MDGARLGSVAADAEAARQVAAQSENLIDTAR